MNQCLEIEDPEIAASGTFHGAENCGAEEFAVSRPAHSFAGRLLGNDYVSPWIRLESVDLFDPYTLSDVVSGFGSTERDSKRWGHADSSSFVIVDEPSEAQTEAASDFHSLEQLEGNPHAVALLHFLEKKGIMPIGFAKTADNSVVFEFGRNAGYFLDVYEHGTVVAVINRADGDDYYEFTVSEFDLLHSLLNAGTLPV